MDYNSYSHWAPPKQDTRGSMGENSKLRILIPKVPPDTFRGKKKKPQSAKGVIGNTPQSLIHTKQVLAGRNCEDLPDLVTE